MQNGYLPFGKYASEGGQEELPCNWISMFYHGYLPWSIKFEPVEPGTGDQDATVWMLFDGYLACKPIVEVISPAGR